MRTRRTPWGIVGAVTAGTALGVAAALAIQEQIRPRMLASPVPVPPEPLAPDLAFPHGLFTEVLRPIVDDMGLVDYEALLHDPTRLYRYVAWLEAYSPLNTPEHFPTDNDRFAYWLNAYNALVLFAVCQHYPVFSVLTMPPVGRFFYALRFNVGGRPMSLEDIEHGVLRPVFADPRIHFALATGTLGGPRLMTQAFLPEYLDEQLEDRATAFMHDPSKVRVDVETHSLLVSPLFLWFRDDFIAWTRAHAHAAQVSLVDYLLPYLSDIGRSLVESEHYVIRTFSFDWRLNRSPRGIQQIEEAA
jgi:hypothetical protein